MEINTYLFDIVLIIFICLVAITMFITILFYCIGFCFADDIKSTNKNNKNKEFPFSEEEYKELTEYLTTKHKLPVDPLGFDAGDITYINKNKKYKESLKNYSQIEIDEFFPFSEEEYKELSEYYATKFKLSKDPFGIEASIRSKAKESMHIRYLKSSYEDAEKKYGYFDFRTSYMKENYERALKKEIDRIRKDGDFEIIYYPDPVHDLIIMRNIKRTQPHLLHYRNLYN